MKLLTTTAVCTQLLLSLLLRSLQQATGMSLELRPANDDVSNNEAPPFAAADVELVDTLRNAGPRPEVAADRQTAVDDEWEFSSPRERSAMKRFRRSLVAAGNHCTTLCAVCRQRIALRYGVPCQRECERLGDGLDQTAGHHYMFCMQALSAGQRSESELHGLVPDDYNS
jgi:hypothetical protein